MPNYLRATFNPNYQTATTDEINLKEFSHGPESFMHFFFVFSVSEGAN